MRKTDILPRLYLPLILIYCAFCSWRPLGAGYDFWAHAAVGRWIWNNGRAPAHGLFLWSAPDYSWVAHSWLSELFFYLVMRLGGPLLVMVMNVVFVGLSFWLVWRFWRSRAPLNFVAPLLFLTAIFASLPRFQPRQETLTATILVILLTFLVRWRDDGESAEKAVLTPANIGIVALFVLWINLHALVFVGLVIVLATLFSDALQYRFDRRARIFAVIAAGCLLATLVNPYSYHYWRAAEQLRPGSQTSFIDEWKPFWHYPQMPFRYVGAEAALFLAALFSWIRNPQRRWAELLWLLLLTVMFVRSRRLLWLTALTCLMVVAANARSFDSAALWALWQRMMGRKSSLEIPEKMRFLVQALCVTILISSITMALRLCLAVSTTDWPPRTAMPETPIKMAALIESRNLPGRIFNDYECSGYLQWTLNGADPKTGRVPAAGLRPLYIDLLSAYPDHLIFDYFDVLAANAKGLKTLQAGKVNTVYLGIHHKGEALTRYLNSSPAWQKLAANEEGFLWTRRQPLR